MRVKWFVPIIALCASVALAGCGGAPAANPATTTAPGGSQATVAAPTTAATTASATVAATRSTAAATTAPAATVAATAKPTSAPTSAAPSGPASDVIINAQRALFKVPAYRVRNTTTAASGTTSVRVTEFVLPDRVHIIQANGMEIIGIKGQAAYIKTNGVWSKQPASIADAYFSILDPKAIEEFTKSLIVDQAKVVGPDLINGKPMLVYQFSTLVKGIGPNGSDLSGTSKIWIGVGDGLPYKLEGESDSAVTAGQKTKTSSVYEYDSSIKIEPPI